MLIQPLLGIADPASSLTHLGGAFVALALGRRLWRRGSVRGVATWSLSVFIASCVLLLATSGLFHAIDHGTPLRALFLRLDHAAIFVLIAGTFTPVHAILFQGAWRWAALAGIWLIALSAITFKTVFFAAVPDSVGTGLYLGMGWLGAGTGWLLWRHYGGRLVRPALLGGLAYTLGAIIEYAGVPNPVPGVVNAHEIFHVAVLAGLCWHWRLVRLVTEQVAVGRPFATVPGVAPATSGTRDELADSEGRA